MPRLEVNVSDEIAETIRGLMAAKGVSATELTRLMVSAYRVIQAIQDDPDQALLVRQGGQLNEIVFG